MPIAAKRSLIPSPAAANTVALPKTATDAELKIIAGFILIMLGLGLIVFDRRRTVTAMAMGTPNSPH